MAWSELSDGAGKVLIQATLIAAVMNIRKLARFGLRTGMAAGMSPHSLLHAMPRRLHTSLRFTFHVDRRLATCSA